ncbi:enkurin domain-containing protein 1 isoform B [Alligator mississippiensis]|uniref:Enkurin domain-containing protein 1 isoform B n=1 Tax=Alligator mississippiensis TaxID=8496 RepID=A0A151NJM2_ALLMI|nr:enkurin domain-containing protein 1 isoform B [Alligator mississippiensis]
MKIGVTRDHELAINVGAKPLRSRPHTELSAIGKSCRLLQAREVVLHFLEGYCTACSRAKAKMCEGPSRITGPIPPDPTLLRDYYKCPLSARGRLEGNALKLDFVSDPLASDPSLYPTCYSARPAQPAPRIRPSGEDILAKGQKGTVGVLLQLEGIFLDKESPPKRKESKNYEKENVRRIREIQKKCKEKELAREHSRPQPVKALWKSQKYENVGSKVKAKIQENSPPPNPESQKFLRAYSRCGSGIQPRRSLSPSPSKTRAVMGTEAPGAQSMDTQIQVEGTSIDFVSHNAQNAKRAQMRRSRSLQSLTEVLEQKRREQEEYNSKQKGHVPRYLLQRKDLWRRETEERLRNLPDPDLPPGHTMMPESQRLETLGNLKQTQAQLTKDLVMLPVRADTLGVQRRRSELEKKLSQIEEALKIFSRPKVFIKLDSPCPGESKTGLGSWAHAAHPDPSAFLLSPAHASYC